MKAKEIILVVAIGSLTACSTGKSYHPSCPTRPTLPTITAEQLEALNAHAYKSLVRRELALINYIELLETHCEHADN